MLSDIEVLEARIRANLDDDDAWDVFGDWLIENGDPRGELIRLERLAERVEDPALNDRIAVLIADHRADWEVAGAPDQTEYGLRHGFISEVAMSDVRHADEITWLRDLQSNPKARFLSTVNLRFYEPDKAELLGPLADIDFTFLTAFQAAYLDFGDDIARVLARHPALALTSLDLRYAALTDDGLGVLGGCSSLRGLRSLYLQNNPISADGAAVLAGSEVFSDLELLDLRFNPIGSEGATALARSSVLGNLTTLRVYADDIEAGGIRALASSSTLNRELVRHWRARKHAR